MPPPPEAPPEFHAACEDFGLVIPEEPLAVLNAYLDFLLETNAQFNLTGVRDKQTAWMRHIFDSLTLAPFLAECGRVIDIGSGGGLPAIPLAIALPDTVFVLVESTGKKAAFLQDCLERFDIDGLVLAERAERLGHDEDHREAYDACTSRGVARLNILVEWMLPFVRPGGFALAMKGQRAADEVEEAKNAFHKLGALPPMLHAIDADDRSVIVEIEKQSETPTKYPREAGQSKRQPL